jgi:hypothetical protein
VSAGEENPTGRKRDEEDKGRQEDPENKPSKFDDCGDQLSR